MNIDLKMLMNALKYDIMLNEDIDVKYCYFDDNNVLQIECTIHLFTIEDAIEQFKPILKKFGYHGKCGVYAIIYDGGKHVSLNEFEIL